MNYKPYINSKGEIYKNAARKTHTEEIKKFQKIFN